MENKLKPIVTKLLIQGENDNERTYVDFYIDPNKITGFYMPKDEDEDEYIKYDDAISGKPFISIIMSGMFFSVLQEDHLVEILTNKFELN